MAVVRPPVNLLEQIRGRGQIESTTKPLQPKKENAAPPAAASKPPPPRPAAPAETPHRPLPFLSEINLKRKTTAQVNAKPARGNSVARDTAEIVQQLSSPRTPRTGPPPPALVPVPEVPEIEAPMILRPKSVEVVHQPTSSESPIVLPEEPFVSSPRVPPGSPRSLRSDQHPELPTPVSQLRTVTRDLSMADSTPNDIESPKYRLESPPSKVRFAGNFAGRVSSSNSTPILATRGGTGSGDGLRASSMASFIEEAEKSIKTQSTTHSNSSSTSADGDTSSSSGRQGYSPRPLTERDVRDAHEPPMPYLTEAEIAEIAELAEDQETSYYEAEEYSESVDPEALRSEDFTNKGYTMDDVDFKYFTKVRRTKFHVTRRERLECLKGGCGLTPKSAPTPIGSLAGVSALPASPQDISGSMSQSGSGGSPATSSVGQGSTGKLPLSDEESDNVFVRMFKTTVVLPGIDIPPSVKASYSKKLINQDLFVTPRVRSEGIYKKEPMLYTEIAQRCQPKPLVPAVSKHCRGRKHLIASAVKGQEKKPINDILVAKIATSE